MANIASPEDRVPRRLDQCRRSAAGREPQSAECYGSDRAWCDSVGQHPSAPSRLFLLLLCKMVHMFDKTCTMCLKCSSLLIEELDVQVNESHVGLRLKVVASNNLSLLYN